MKRHAAPIIAALLLLLPVLYMASYLALMDRFTVTIKSGGRVQTHVVVHYRIGGATAGTFFWPLEQIDRKLRPDVWSGDSIPIPGLQ